MRDLRKRYSYEQRNEFQQTLSDLRPYLISVLLDRQGGVCDICKQPQTKWDIHHKLYNPMETINELQLLCIPCHHSITDYSHLT